jgi:serine/threonine protein kinase
VLAYAPPELLVAGPRDRRADLYSTGAIAYALLAGRPPFAESSARERIRAILHEAPPPFPDKVRDGLPRGLAELVLRLMSKELDRRPSTAREAIDALDAAVPGA